ncbi:MAG: hypothetical protein KAX16_07715, partial [Actinomycetia bacterium]|nr:hypothetical protein [Actinomycetes bacterium]
MITTARRNTELWGLILVSLIFYAGTAIVRATQAGFFSFLPIKAVTLLFAFLIAHLFLRYGAREADSLLFPICAYLATLG